jgi:hypothetical protein
VGDSSKDFRRQASQNLGKYLYTIIYMEVSSLFRLSRHRRTAICVRVKDPFSKKTTCGTRECWSVWGSSAGVMWSAPGVTPALLGTDAAHLVIERVEVLGAVDGGAVEAYRLLARTPCRKLRLESLCPIGRAFSGLGSLGLGKSGLCHSLPFAFHLQPPCCSSHVQPGELRPRGRGHGAAFASRAAALSPLCAPGAAVRGAPSAVSATIFDRRW